MSIPPALAQGTVDYDADGDGLIEVSSLAQLNAIRWDLDGDGAADVYPPASDGRTGHDPDGASKLAAAFPQAEANMGCPSSGCAGYELAADLDFDTNGSGAADAGDEFWNGGKGWVPLIGGEAIYDAHAEIRFEDHVGSDYSGERPHSRARMFTGVFEGNGRTISNLFIDDSARRYVGLFGYIGPEAHVRNFGLTKTNSDSGVRGNWYTGALAGLVERGRVSGVYSHLDVSGHLYVGGLVGVTWRYGFVIESYATGDVYGTDNVGGLVGMLNWSGVAASYATGDVSSWNGTAGGLAGYWPDGRIRATYATGSVTLNGNLYVDWYYGLVESRVGGLVGSAAHCGGHRWPRLRANYATGALSGPQGAAVGGLTGGCIGGWGENDPADVSYWDTDTTGTSTNPTVDEGGTTRVFGRGYTTAQLQAPTGYTGIYAGWNVDVDVESYWGPFDGPGDDPWDFGSSSQYPVLKYCAAKPGIVTADGQPYCPLQPSDQRRSRVVVPDDDGGSTGDDDGDGGLAEDHPLVRYAVLVKSFYDRITDRHVHGDGASGGWNKRFLKAMGHPEYVGYPQPAVTVADAQRMYDHGGPGANAAWEGTAEAVQYKLDYDAGTLTTTTTTTTTTDPPTTQDPEITVTGGSGITEGGTASFTIEASPAPDSPITVNIGVTQDGDWGAAGAATVTVSGASTTYTITTSDDQTDEADGSVTATVKNGTGYTVGTASSASVNVSDDDQPLEHPLVKYADLVQEFYDRITARHVHGDSSSGRLNKMFLSAMGHAEYVDYPHGKVTSARAQEIWEHNGPSNRNQAWEGTAEAVQYKLDYDSGALATTTDPPPAQIPEVTITAGSGITEGGTASFTVTADPAPASPITVNVGVGEDGDWGATGAATVTVSGASTAYTITTSDDETDEADGSVTATVESGTGYTVGSASSASVAVSDDDDPPPAVPEITISGGGAITEGGTAGFTINASPAPSGAVEVSIGVTQTGGYGATGAATVSVSGASAAYTVSVPDNGIDQADGSVTVTVLSGAGYTVGSSSSRTVAISDDDVPEITITAGSAITEGGTAGFTITATPAPHSPITVNVGVGEDGDFGATGAATVTVSGTSTAYTITTSDDETDEADGSVTATVESGTGYTVGSASSASVAVTDDDDPPPVVGNAHTLHVSIRAPIGVVLPGETAEFSVTLSEKAQQDVTIAYTVSISGMWNSDWAIESDNPLTIPEGESSGVIKVKIHDHAWYANDHTTYWINLQVTSVTGAKTANGGYGRTRAK